jgi:hypothetical protein
VSGLIEVNFPTNLPHIGDWAFYGCIFLLSVRLPQELGEPTCLIGRAQFKWSELIASGSMVCPSRLRPNGSRMGPTLSALPVRGEYSVDSLSTLTN